MSVFDSALATLTVKKGTSAASVSLIRYGDGTMEFIDANGNKVRETSSNVAMKKLFDKINSLV
ncbi:MAG TPA: hypothetical protein VM639_22925 [Dongiaceae bacterium]|nr:hypothetical protein [Dongiaceae bacterium]